MTSEEGELRQRVAHEDRMAREAHDLERAHMHAQASMLYRAQLAALRNARQTR